MPKHKYLLALCLLMISAFTMATPSNSLGAGAGAFAVVVAKSFPVDGISLGDLKRLYMGNPVQAGGKNLVPLTYPKAAPERVAFDEAVLGMSADEAGRYWIDRKIRGQSGPPKAVDSAGAILKVVAKVEGAIGFVKAGAVTPDVKVLRVDGKLPSEGGYRVKN